MALPQEIGVRYAQDDAGYVSMRPVVKQTFRLNELADMVVSVVGKDAERVQQIFRTGAVVYNGYHYWWDPVTAELAEVRTLLAPFPEDDPSRAFDPASATAVLFESGGGSQRSVVEITAQEAGSKKLFGKTSAWEVLTDFSRSFVPRYEKYSYGRRVDMFRLTIPFDRAQPLLAAMLEAAPRALRHRWSALRPPSAITFVCPR
ncbi:MAG: hypothetical protein WAK48_04580 [Candidatus Acidiferrum sp.]|jgi:hypothetical protein